MGHSHSHPHAHAGHSHDPGSAAGQGSVAALRWAFFLNLGFTAVEAIGGWWTNSIAVLTDALHDGGDCLVLGAAWYLQGVALRGRDAQYSYGYGRYSMLGGWLTAVVLILGALFMIGASVPRLFAPTMPDTTGMMGIAVFGLLMNSLAAWKLHGGQSLNERGAYLHLLEDVLGWATVLIGGGLIKLTGWAVIDPLLSMAISIFILVNAIGTLRRGTGILMQEQPPSVDIQTIRTRLMAIPHVVDLHDQHTWTLDGSLMVHTVHIVVDQVEPAEVRTIKQQARSVLKKAGIQHATIEIEWVDEDCGTHC